VRATIAAPVAAIAAAAGILDLLVAGNPPLHSVLLASVCLAAALATGNVLPRKRLAVLAAGLPVLWRLTYHADTVVLAAALVPAVATLGTPQNRWLSAVLAGAYAAGVGAIVQGEVPIVVGSGLTALAFVAVRPRTPTDQQLSFFRSVALFAPALVLVGLMSANAATGIADGLTVRRVLHLSVGLAGLLAFIAVALLGQLTLLESEDPAQRHLWAMLGATLAVPFGLLATADASAVMANLALAAVPLAVGASITVARLEAEAGWARWISIGPPLLAVVSQLGLS